MPFGVRHWLPTALASALPGLRLPPMLVPYPAPVGANAYCLTCGSHQRSAWRYRSELSAPVYAPALAQELDEAADERYGDGDPLPGGLRAVFTPGAGTTQHTLVREGQPDVAFCPDLLVRPDGEVALVRVEEYDPEKARRSIERLLELSFSLLCLTQGHRV